MKLLDIGFRWFYKSTVFIIGLYYLFFVLDKIMMFADLNPGYYRIESYEQLNEEGWVIPLGFQVARDSAIALIAFLGVFRYKTNKKYYIIITVLGLALWLMDFYWLDNVFSMLNRFQRKAWFLWQFVDLFVLLMVMGRQLYLARKSTLIEQN